MNEEVDITDNPLVTEEGDVMIYRDLYRNALNYYQNVSEYNRFFKLEGLPPILSAFRIYRHLIMLTHRHEVLVINQSYPNGIIINTPPIKRLVVYMDRAYVLDVDNNLYELIKDDSIYSLSDLYIPNVMFFSCYFKSVLIVIDQSNKLYVFNNGNINRIHTTFELDYEVKLLLDNASRIVMLDIDDNIWELERDKIEVRGSINYPFKYITYIGYILYTIDYDGILRRQAIAPTWPSGIIPGVYTKFCNISHVRTAVEDVEGGYGLLIGKNINQVNLPFRLFSMQEYELNMWRPTIKSARFTGM